MFTHRWYFKGKVIKIIDGQTIEIWIDLGFDIWKKIQVRFNRLKINPSDNSILNFLNQYVKGKQAYFQIFKTKDFERYYVEMYCQPGDIVIRLKDVNRSLNNPYRIDGLLNINDTIVSQKLATYFNFSKTGEKNASVNIRN
jgi:micrococcal nuclease